MKTGQKYRWILSLEEIIEAPRKVRTTKPKRNSKKKRSRR
jgi:hypothetical protein